VANPPQRIVQEASAAAAVVPGPEGGHTVPATRVPAGLYVHTPFCESKCGYCDFFSVAKKDRESAPLVERVRREVLSRVAGAEHDIRTIFVGGGTPTVLPTPELDALLQTVREATAGHPVIEFTVEANPGTVDDAKAALLVGHGVNRVSMGAQSFFEAELETLERLHSPADIPQAIKTLRRSGMPQINIDLIFGIPGQTADTWRESLRRAVDLGIDHVSCYGLMYEPGTRLTAQRAAGRVTPCDEEIEADLFEMTVELLAESGHEQYEISNFARPGRQCEHNLIYWRNEPYLGAGPSASGCYAGRRYRNIADVAGYVRMIDERGHAESETETLTPKTNALEMILMQLRLTEGLSRADFLRRTGQDALAVFGPTAERFVADGVLRVTPEALVLTRRGMLVANSVMASLAVCLDAGDIALPILRSGG
jgi:oxygen-independent coproporphyrinogen-3 oxidase